MMPKPASVTNSIGLNMRNCFCFTILFRNLICQKFDLSKICSYEKSTFLRSKKLATLAPRYDDVEKGRNFECQQLCLNLLVKNKS